MSDAISEIYRHAQIDRRWLHEWFEFHGVTACRRCGVVQRRDGLNKPCPGKTAAITTREEPHEQR